jgi:DNA polymerase I-like protein with 3'-5' exonuclease and polymerase domains
MSEIDSKPILSVDTETTGLDPYTSKLFLIQINDGSNNYVFDVRHHTEHSSIHPSLFNPIWINSNLKILQNALFDMKMIKVHGGVYLNNVYDTMLAEQILTLGRVKARSNLAALMKKYLGLHMPKEPRKTFSDDTIRLKPYQIEYAANDVVPLQTIMDLQKLNLEEEELLHVSELEFDFLKPLCEMELNGIRIDNNKWAIIMDDIELEAIRLEKELTSMLASTDDQMTLFGASTININSQQQLLKALNRYGLHDLESTDVNILKSYQGLPVVDKLLSYRKYKKLCSTYGQTLLDKINPITNRLHTAFKQMVSTGRLSSANPNLQNIPNKQLYRTGFIAEDGYTLLTADMSSCELRILANLSMDPVFLKVYKDHLDLHTMTASAAFSVDYDKVNHEQRKKAKPLNFGLCYGLSKFGLARQLGISDKEAENMIDNFFGQYRQVKEFLDESAILAIDAGYTKSISGRKRYYELPPFYDPDFKRISKSVQRQGKNMPIQGCLVGDSLINGLGFIKDYVDRDVVLETGFGRDVAFGVYSGVKDTYDVVLSNGSTLGITSEHKIPVISNDGMYLDKSIFEIDLENDYLLIPLKSIEGSPTCTKGYKYKKGHWRETYKDFDLPDFMSKNLSFIIGCIIGDGNYSNYNNFSLICPENQIELFNKFNSYIKNLFNYEPVITTYDKYVKKDGSRAMCLYHSQISSVVIRGFLKHIGLNYVTAREKIIPDYFFNETIENKGSLLNGLFSTDGGMTEESGPNFTTSSKKLCYGVQNLLFSLGINSNLKTYTEGDKFVYRLQVPKRFNNKFKNLIGFSVNYKNNSLEKELNVPKRWDRSLVPFFIPKLIEESFRRNKSYYNKLNYNEKAHLRRFKLGSCSYSSWRKFYYKLPKCKEKGYLSQFINFDFCKIDSIEYRGKEPTYDLMCKNIHYFTSNGVIVHNSNADTIKKSMIYLVDRLEKSGLDARLVLTVHDEVVVEARSDQVDEVAPIVKQSLIDGFGYYFSTVPMETDVLIGPCWLKEACEAKDKNGVECKGTVMKFVEDEKLGTKLVCAKCGGDMQ